MLNKGAPEAQAGCAVQCHMLLRIASWRRPLGPGMSIAAALGCPSLARSPTSTWRAADFSCAGTSMSDLHFSVACTVVDAKRADQPGLDLPAKMLRPNCQILGNDLVNISSHSRAARDLSPPGELTSQVSLPFEFNSVEMEHDSFRGLQVRLRCVGILN